MSRLPIKALKELANKNGQDIVIVFGADSDGHTTHVATWGRSIEECDKAARWGNNMKEKLGWPDSLTHAEPSRVRRLQKQIKELEEIVREKNVTIEDMYNSNMESTWSKTATNLQMEYEQKHKTTLYKDEL